MTAVRRRLHTPYRRSSVTEDRVPLAAAGSAAAARGRCSVEGDGGSGGLRRGRGRVSMRPPGEVGETPKLVGAGPELAARAVVATALLAGRTCRGSALLCRSRISPRTPQASRTRRDGVERRWGGAEERWMKFSREVCIEEESGMFEVDIEWNRGGGVFLALISGQPNDLG
ncbi:uncharacterized protein A4U43_C09F15150 [Asparagus officinalis]|uniref:Uncharacterized protein n=1 Tax=Asparagus officinalis TaxID=4686 RepID=A0A5P1E7I5_ASPOF|nr:uncharacterized protein A4U43_C09F15150 [Asparagus officinalis]